jgi:hypothetical protein
VRSTASCEKAFFQGGNDAWMKIWAVSIDTSTLKDKELQVRREEILITQKNIQPHWGKCNPGLHP